MANFYKHIVVVHGIGRQKLNETGVDFMNEFCRSLPSVKGFDLTVRNFVARDTDTLIKDASKPAYVIFNACGNSYFIGFSEVYWQGYLAKHNEQPPVPIFTWAHSINSRIRGEERGGQSLSVWREAIDNAESLLDLARKIASISKKACLFDGILRDFLGDVQMYAEVDDVHEDINKVFRAALDDIADVRAKIRVNFDSNEIYIVAHSEGTVVSWKSLQLAAVENPAPAWLGAVKGFVTLGSPIDKHHLIWGEQNFPPDIEKPLDPKIRWWNFWDYSDPVGHSLDGVFGDESIKENKQFRRECDKGYARYPIPGKAHVDYWKHIELHHRIIKDVMELPVGGTPGYPPQEVEVEVTSRLNWKAMRAGDFVAYGLARGAEIVALIYFLSHLLNPVRQGLIQVWKSVGPWLDQADTWPLHTGPMPMLRCLNAAIWTLGTAWVWKLVWDIGLLNY